MLRVFFAGLAVGGAIAFIYARQRAARAHRRNNMTAEEKIIARAQALSAERPETAKPDRNFIRDWAYGNAGLEDESITVEQVEKVLGGRLA